jgi:hypothetical protein
MDLEEIKTLANDCRSKVLDEWGRYEQTSCHKLWWLCRDKDGDIVKNTFIFIIIIQLYVL